MPRRQLSSPAHVAERERVHDASDPRVILRAINQAVHSFALALEEVELPPRMREAPLLPQGTRSRRTNTRQTLVDVVLACEALATVTGPTALVSGNLARARDEARRLHATLRAIKKLGDAGALSTSGPSATQADTETSALPLMVVLGSEPVRSALTTLCASLADLALSDDDMGMPPPRMLRFGARFLIPVSVLVITVILILFFAGGIAFATGAVALSPQGVVISNPITNTAPENTAREQDSLQNLPAPTQQPGANGTPSVPAPTGGNDGRGGGSLPTPTPARPAPTPTNPSPPAPMVTILPTTLQPCPKETIEITYVSGSGAISWQATTDSADMPLSTVLGGETSLTVSGTLQPSERAKVFLAAQRAGIKGQITVTLSTGTTTIVSYDATACA